MYFLVNRDRLDHDNATYRRGELLEATTQAVQTAVDIGALVPQPDLEPEPEPEGDPAAREPETGTDADPDAPPVSDPETEPMVGAEAEAEPAVAEPAASKPAPRRARKAAES